MKENGETHLKRVKIQKNGFKMQKIDNILFKIIENQVKSAKNSAKFAKKFLNTYVKLVLNIKKLMKIAKKSIKKIKNPKKFTKKY